MNSWFACAIVIADVGELDMICTSENRKATKFRQFQGDQQTEDEFWS